MKRPYCIVDGKRYKLHEINGVIRFPDDGRVVANLKKLIIDYAYGRIALKELWDYYSNSGCSYELVRGIFSKTGQNNHIVLQGNESTKSMRLYI